MAFSKGKEQICLPNSTVQSSTSLDFSQSSQMDTFASMQDFSSWCKESKRQNQGLFFSLALDLLVGSHFLLPSGGRIPTITLFHVSWVKSTHSLSGKLLMLALSNVRRGCKSCAQTIIGLPTHRKEGQLLFFLPSSVFSSTIHVSQEPARQQQFTPKMLCKTWKTLRRQRMICNEYTYEFWAHFHDWYVLSASWEETHQVLSWKILLGQDKM